MGKPDSLARLDSAHRSAVGAAGQPYVHDKAQRAAIILQSADGARARHLAEVFRRSKPAIWLWRGGEVWADPQLMAAEVQGDAEITGYRLLGVQSEGVMVGIYGKAFGLFLPALTDVFVRGEAFESFASLGKVVSHEESLEMLLSVLMGLIIGNCSTPSEKHLTSAPEDPDNAAMDQLPELER